MQPTNYHIPSGELPQPQTDYDPSSQAQDSLAVGNEQQQAQAIETANAVPIPTPPPMPPANPATDLTTATFGAAAQPMAQSTNVSPHSPLVADDNDLIEKEWVLKAKHIVESTKDDPYLQTKEMNKMKADYLKKRYAKELKLPEN